MGARLANAPKIMFAPAAVRRFARVGNPANLTFAIGLMNCFCNVAIGNADVACVRRRCRQLCYASAAGRIGRSRRHPAKCSMPPPPAFALSAAI
ncbi:hypothetical protein KCP74_11425 [Salmonella enterica subsp. enterica]|nr:hypothetical protein KCP74_11425 [Salmonella enterica subsp. enterica]